MVRQYQIVLFPERLRAYGIPHSRVIAAVRSANRETGGSVLELGEAEYMVRASGYLKTLDDFNAIPLMTSESGVPVRLGDVAKVYDGVEDRYNTAGDAVVRTAYGRKIDDVLIRRFAKDYPWRKNARDITDAALAWIGRKPDRPFFVFLNYFDVHDPYLPPPRFRAELSHTKLHTGHMYGDSRESDVVVTILKYAASHRDIRESLSADSLFTHRH